MSIEAPAAQKKINLRRPDIMEAVQAQVLSHYRSELVERIRAKAVSFPPAISPSSSPRNSASATASSGPLTWPTPRAKYFSEVSPHTPIYLLGEIIHNPEVNDQIRHMGIQIISPKPTDEELAQLESGDVVIIPAFGTEVGTRQKLEAKGCVLVDTTCGDVMSVWKRVRQYSKENVTSIIHGKAKHEETKATTSQARAYGSGHYLVVFNLAETDYVCNYILHGGNKEEFLEKFKGAYSAGFDPDIHLQAVGVANQTTMLRGETEEVQRRIKTAMIKKYGEAEIEKHFRFFDTICGATQDRQDALEKLLREPMDLLLVIGGYNSSNTSHLAEMGEAKLPTYFIKNAAKMVSDKLIRHFDLHRRQEIETPDWLPSGKITVGVTAGASCPNNLIEDTIRRLFELRGISVQELLSN